MNKITIITAASASGLALTTALSGCAMPGSLPPGTTIDAVRHGARSPSDEYALPDGGKRLEFAQGGGFNRETWMLDFDTKGTLVSSQQVLTEANFANITPGMPADEVRLRLGRPVQVFGAGWQEHIQVWNYRFTGGHCVWFQVSIRDADQKVREAGIGQDPACDGPSRTRD